MRHWRRSKPVGHIPFPSSPSKKFAFWRLIYSFRIVTELMILGFISLILVFSQYYIADICIPTHVANTMLPCPLKDEKGKGDGGNRRLLWYERRILAGDKKPECKEVNVVFLSNIVLLLIK